MRTLVIRAAVAALVILLFAPGSSALAQTPPKATPAKIQLDAGGKPVKVVLQGKNLDAFASAQVFLNNRPVKEIVAKLDKGSGTKRTLTLTAIAGAKAGSRYTVLPIDAKTKKPVELKLQLAVAAPNQPPVIAKIDAPKQVEAGVPFEIKITATDDKGVAVVELKVGGKPQVVKGRGRKKEVLTVALTANKAGTLVIEAVAVDGDKLKSAKGTSNPRVQDNCELRSRVVHQGTSSPGPDSALRI